ncbi:MAG: hypothetical protein HWD61_07690 [Parachlamydiaceae bacterium]|nr:MAG: hypothetical protein HWD61_07690 [Parachlamydiaceae bacterium]
MAANHPKLASKLEKSVDGMRGNKVDFEETPYAALPVMDPDAHYAPIAVRSEIQEPPSIQNPFAPRSVRDLIQIPETKTRLGSGVSKQVFGLRRRGDLTKRLLKQIKIKPKILTPSQLNALLPGIQALAVSFPDKEAKVNKLIEK